MQFEMLRQPLHFMSDRSAAPQWLRDADAELQAADGFVVVTPEYNCGLPPALVNMLDHFPPASYRHRPVGIACYSLGEKTRDELINVVHVCGENGSWYALRVFQATVFADILI